MVKVFLSDLPVEAQAELLGLFGKGFTKKFNKGEVDAFWELKPDSGTIVSIIR